MFGTNKIEGVKFFKSAPSRQLMVTSRFFTLQGEGPYRGEPAFFIRLTKCNLACSFCDTYFDKGEYYTFDKIFKDAAHEIHSHFEKRNIPLWATGRRKIVLVITGGEPSLQANLSQFLREADEHFFKSQIESNGISILDDIPKETTLVVSPKCLEKGDIAIRYLEPNKEMLARADCLKFVMCTPENNQFSPYSEVPSWGHTWAEETGKPVFVSPMNIYLREPQKAKQMRAEKDNVSIAERSLVDEVISWWEPGLLDMKANQRNHEYTFAYCMDHGFTFNMQLHLFGSAP